MTKKSTTNTNGLINSSVFTTDGKGGLGIPQNILQYLNEPKFNTPLVFLDEYHEYDIHRESALDNPSIFVNSGMDFYFKVATNNPKISSLTHHQINKTYDKGITLLFIAMNNENFTLAKELLEGGANPNLQSGVDKNTPLHLFFTIQRTLLFTDTLKALLEHRADLFIKNNQNITPFDLMQKMILVNSNEPKLKTVLDSIIMPFIEKQLLEKQLTDTSYSHQTTKI